MLQFSSSTFGLMRAHRIAAVAAFLCVLGCVLPWHRVDAAGHAPTIVYPTGQFPNDVNNVQVAVSAGGQVLLAATDSAGKPTSFNFGPAAIGGGGVVVNSDVAVRGTMEHGQMTTIVGGNLPFFVFSPSRIAIEGIHFKGPRGAAIAVEEASDVVISDNVIDDVLGYDNGFGLTIGFGMTVSAQYAAFANRITGNVLVQRNVINNVHAQVGYGIEVSELDADVTIIANTVTGINLNGILVGGILQHALIAANLVIPGPAQDPNFTSGNGIFVGHARGGRFEILDNRVICSNAYADGIAFIGSPELPVEGSLVEGNDVTMHGSLSGGISFYDNVSDVHVAGNFIHGDGTYALQVSALAADTPASAVGDSFELNDIRGFRAAVADIFLDVIAANTVLCRQPGTVIDNGSNTRVTSECFP